MKTPQPEPVVVTTVCSLCGESWQAHGDKPTSEDCIRLLLAKVRQLEACRPTIIYRDLWPRPVYPVYPTYPTWSNGTQITCGSTTGNVATDRTVTYNTPAINASCVPVESAA